jgi:hypothetical protein
MRHVPRRPPPTIPKVDPNSLSRQRRFAFGAVVISAALLALTLANPPPPEETRLSLRIVRTADAAWTESAMEAAIAQIRPNLAVCREASPEGLASLPLSVDLLVGLGADGKMGAALEGPQLPEQLSEPDGACLIRAVEAVSWPRPPVDRAVRIPLRPSRSGGARADGANVAPSN